MSAGEFRATGRQVAVIITKRPATAGDRWRALWAFRAFCPVKGTGTVYGWTEGDTRAEAVADALQYIDPDGDRSHGIVEGH